MTTDLLTPQLSDEVDDLIALASPVELGQHDPQSFNPIVRIRLKFTNQPPNWFGSLMDEAAHLLNLKPGWDSYGAEPIQLHTFVSALELLALIVRPGLPKPNVFPLAEGGLAFEWTRVNRSLEVFVTGRNQGELLYEDYVTDTAVEEEFTSLGTVLTYVGQFMD